MSERLEEMLRIARAATRGPWYGPHLADDDVACNCASIVCGGYAGAICTIDVNNGLAIGDGGNDAPPLEEAKANGRHIATFNPRTAEALVKVALAAAKLLQVGKTNKYADCKDCCVENGVVEALSALTAAMASEDGQSPAEGLSEAKPSEEDNSNVG